MNEQQVDDRDSKGPPGDVGVDGFSAMGPVERANVAMLLENVSRRMSSIESKLAGKEPESRQWGNTIAELTKIVFAGWPVFGLVFLLLFYKPLSAAINAMPDKVKRAEEMSAFGISLKATIQKEAEKVGSLELSETLPALPPAAVELLLRSDRERNTMTSYSPGATGITRVWFPAEQKLTTLEELEAKELIQIIRDFDNEQSVKTARAEFEKFKKQYPGRETPASRSDATEWELSPPREVDVPNFAWKLTDLGKKAVDVIVNAVSTQLNSGRKG